MLTADLIEHPGCAGPIKSSRKIVYGRLVNVSSFQLIEMLPQESAVINLFESELLVLWHVRCLSPSPGFYHLLV